MKFTIQWLKDHLETKLSDEKIIDNLTSIGLEVESFEKIANDFDQFVVAKITNIIYHYHWHGERSQMVKAVGCDSTMRGFNSRRSPL